MLSGFTSNGEFNSLRCKGNTRPLSVLQLKADVRAKYATMKQQTMRAMLSPKRIGLANGSVTAEFPDPAVSTSLLLQILQWKEEGATEEDIHCRLRCHTVPDGYSYTTWKPGVLRVA